MAVKDESLHHATEALILPKPRNYYRASISTSHWQLRSLIGSPEQNVIYYPSGFEIYALHPKTKEREIVTTLSFSPRCLTVGGGWLCCGGQHGDYTAIPIGDNTIDTSLNLDFDVDARLPLDLDFPRRSLPRDTPSTSRRSRGHSHRLLAPVKKIGNEPNEKDDAINNCITLWFPPKNTSEQNYESPVAVVANNDKSVYILNLEDSELLERLTYPDCVNRAVMSPDGELLVAVLDDPFLYVHERKRKSSKWVGACRIQLPGQSHADKTTMKGSFAMSFSNSGKYLAVATQYGLISVFDVQTLTQEDAEPLVVFTSSRPGRIFGAIREMEFSPGPFDLLAWTETSGRAGVADLRNLFLSRQVLMVDSRLDGIERIRISEKSEEATIDPRLRVFRTDSPASSSTTPDYLGLDAERRHLRHLTREMLDRHQSPLTTEELEVLQAHRIARRQRDALAEVAGSSGWGPWAAGERTTARSSTIDGETSASSERRISTAGLPAALREFVNPDRNSASFRSFINERNQDRERRNQQLEPRRRSSVILAAAERAVEQETLGQPTRNGNDASTSTSTGLGRLTLTPPRLGDSDSPDNPWAEIDALYRSRYSADPPDRATRLRIELEDDERSGFAQRLRRPFGPLGELGVGNRDESLMLRGVLRRSNEDEDKIPETMGLCWSPDGRILYIGAEDGIYEYHVNIPGRKKFPSLVLR